MMKYMKPMAIWFALWSAQILMFDRHELWFYAATALTALIIAFGVVKIMAGMSARISFGALMESKTGAAAIEYALIGTLVGLPIAKSCHCIGAYVIGPVFFNVADAM